MLTYRTPKGGREVIYVPKDLERSVMDVFMNYLDRVVTYALGAEQDQKNRSNVSRHGPLSSNRPGPQGSIRRMERELAVDFLARRMALPADD